MPSLIESIESTAKQQEINNVLAETKNEMNSFQKFLETIKGFLQNPSQALQNLFSEVATENKQSSATITVETQQMNNTAKKVVLDKSKPMSEYTPEETKSLFSSIFGD